MTIRSLRVSICAALTMLMLVGSVGVARAQEGPVDHLRHRAHQIVRETHRIVRHHRPPVVRIYVGPRRHYHRYRYRVYDHRHHRYYWVYRR